MRSIAFLIAVLSFTLPVGVSPSTPARKARDSPPQSGPLPPKAME